MAKKKYPEMLPVKKWLSLPEAMAFLDMCKNTFLDTAIKNNLTVSAIGQKKYYRVDQLEKLIEGNIIIN